MELKDFFDLHPRAALAFSGGTDSSYLLYAAKKCGAQVGAYFVKSSFQPEFELEDARRLAAQVGAELTVLTLDVLSHTEIRANPADRCYHCKRAIFSALTDRARADGYDCVIDGTNASDDAGDRPGIRALRELGVLSPLRDCGITKSDVRALSREAGLFTWGKPSYACLATRFPAGEALTEEGLRTTERSEGFLASLGLSDLRVRCDGGRARIQVPEAQLMTVLEHRREILDELGKSYRSVSLDLEVRG